MHSDGVVTALSRDASHRFSKAPVDSITLVEGIGVEGDAHAGRTVQHRSRVARDPSQPNLRQVHLIHSELHDEVRAAGFVVEPGELGENVTTRGIDLLGLPTGTVLRLGAYAVVEITGLRNPCFQIDDFQHGLLKQVLHRSAETDGDADGEVVRRAGIMGVVRRGGDVRAGDPIVVERPSPPHRRLEPV